MGPQMRVLLVDDDEVDRRICRRALARYEPAPEFVDAETAEEALRWLAARDFDCVLLDFRLPDMDGLDLLKRLSDRAVEVRVPIIMLTGASDVAVAVEAMRCGASDYLVKDVDGRYQALIPTIVRRAMRERDLQLAKWHADQALVQYRVDLSELTQRLMVQEKTMTRRLAQTLHDQLGQTLTAIRLTFDAVVAAQRDRMPPEVDRRARLVDTLIDQAVREVRQVLVELRPPLLDEHGLFAALDNELRTRSQAHDHIDLRLEAQPACAELRWPADVEYAAFMIAREAIGNAIRHAQPASVRVVLTGAARSLSLNIVDDGSGMAPAATSRPGHLGMVGIRERAQAIGAQCSVRSAPGDGTSVCLAWQQPT